MYCNNCGSEAENGNAFCLDCGHEIEYDDVYCAECDQLAEEGDLFCYWCGDKLPIPTVENAPVVSLTHNRPNEPQMQCRGCSEYLNENALFCEQCGENISANKAQAPVSTAATTVAPFFAPPVQQKPATPITMDVQEPLPRMPLIFLLDTSASTRPYIDELNTCINQFKAEVSKDERVSSILDVAIIQFNNNSRILQNLAPIEKMKPVRLITAGQANYTPPIKEALHILDDFDRQNDNAYQPWIIMISGSNAIDDLASVADDLRQQSSSLRFIALGAPGYNSATLKQITDAVFKLDGTDFSNFFSWISQSMWAIAATSPGEKVNYPPLPDNVRRDA